jgi:tRNA (uracil-5-)-methyltransferase TRM9
MTTYIENNVINTYDVIALDFDKTRFSIWKCVRDFSQHIDKDAYILDMGCGNGKNMNYFLNNGWMNIRGCDASVKFVSLCQSKSLNVIYGNILSIPHPDNTFDCVICIAVLHHLSTEQHRIDAINELIRVTKPSGKILITVASYEFPFYKNLGDEQDCMIPWKNNTDKSIIGTRYYHLFKKGELESLCQDEKLKSMTGFFELDNWCVIITKN